MKKLFLIASVGLIMGSCQNKEDNPKPNTNNTQQEQRITPIEQPKLKADIKVTLLSNKLPYIYRRKHVYQLSPLVIEWKDDTCKTNTSIFYETFVNDSDYLESTVQLTHATPYKSGESSQITAEYNGRKTTSTSLSGQTFAVVFLKNVK